jgi:hypothetical protein
MKAMSCIRNGVFGVLCAAALGFGAITAGAQPSSSPARADCTWATDPVTCAECCAAQGAWGSKIINGRCHCMF